MVSAFGATGQSPLPSRPTQSIGSPKLTPLSMSPYPVKDTPTTSNFDPTDVATRLAKFVIDYDLDGVGEQLPCLSRLDCDEPIPHGYLPRSLYLTHSSDIDYEDFPAYTSNLAIPWLHTFQVHLRSLLPSPTYLISHAPLAVSPPPIPLLSLLLLLGCI